MSGKIPKFETVKAEYYRTVYASGVFGSVNPNEGTIIFYVDRLIPKSKDQPPGSMGLETVLHELQVEVKVSPMQFKSIADWMQKHLQELEKIVGKLPTPKKERQPYVA